jgi:hypothetical protein
MSRCASTTIAATNALATLSCVAASVSYQHALPDTQRLSSSAKEALGSQKPVPPTTTSDFWPEPRPSGVHASFDGLAVANASAAGRPGASVSKWEFQLQWHGYQCLVHSAWARGATPAPDGDVTWVTQMSADRVGILEKTLERWKGPVSVALYSQDVESDVAAVAHLLGRVDFHVVGASQGLYPVNTLRNVAINNARTDFVFLADVDFVPDADAYEGLKAHVRALKAAGKDADKAVWVLPAFEIDGAEQIVPLDFAGLKQMGRSNHPGHNAGGGETAPPPPPPRTKWKRRVPHPVLIGHAAPLTGAQRRGARDRAQVHAVR